VNVTAREDNNVCVLTIDGELTAANVKEFRNLVEQKLITREQVDEALNVQKRSGNRKLLGEIIIELGFVIEGILQDHDDADRDHTDRGDAGDRVADQDHGRSGHLRAPPPAERGHQRDRRGKSR